MRMSVRTLTGYVGLVFALCSVGMSAVAGSPFDTTAKVGLTANDKDLPLKREEQIALMFLTAMMSIEDDCLRHARHGCSIDELVNGGVNSNDQWPIAKLKFDPRSTDPNYTYTLTAANQKWECKATPKKAGLGGYYVVREGFGFAKLYYNAQGEASASSLKTDGYSVAGDVFWIK